MTALLQNQSFWNVPHSFDLDAFDPLSPPVSDFLPGWLNVSILSPGEIRSSENSYFCQAARQLACVPSSQLCVKLASGGDPTYAFNIRFTGEEVHGTSRNLRSIQQIGEWFKWNTCGPVCVNVALHSVLRAV